MSSLPYDRMMSDRSGETLAPKYGFDDLAQLAESLPTAAQVLDVGAGLSTLGRDVCQLRGDITWVNADSQYGDPGRRYAARFQEALERAPRNLAFEEANAVDLADIFGSEQFDRVFSYWMLPHILRRDEGAAVHAAENMLLVAKHSGSVAVGPVNRPYFSRAALLGNAMEVRPAADRSVLRNQAGRIVERHRRLEAGQRVRNLLNLGGQDLKLPSLTD